MSRDCCNDGHQRMAIGYVGVARRPGIADSTLVASAAHLCDLLAVAAAVIQRESHRSFSTVAVRAAYFSRWGVEWWRTLMKGTSCVVITS